MKNRPVLVLASLSLVLGVACSENTPPAKLDAGSVRSPDAAPDTRPLPDAAAPDAAEPDRPVPDAPPADTAAPDAAPDAAADAVTADAAATDAAPDATVPPDAGAPDAGPTCVGNVSRAMLCTTYCQGLGRFCLGSNAQFASPEACDRACNADTWPCGNPGDTTGNSLLCRLAHLALAGVGSAAMECPNAGPNSPTCR